MENWIFARGDERDVVITVGSAARSTAESTTSSRSVILVVRHVVVAVSKTMEVDADTTAGNGESTLSCQVARPGSTETKSEVSVRQQSRIR